MPVVNRNILNNTTPTLITAQSPYGTMIQSLSLCNVSLTDVVISLTKVWDGNPNQTYFLIKNMTLESGRSFVYKNIQLQGTWKLNITIAGGHIDADIVYVNLTQ